MNMYNKPRKAYIKVIQSSRAKIWANGCKT